MVGFSVRTYVASMVALYIAFALQLESPLWAWLTVWIVSQPTPGMALSKGLYRFIGTIAGSIGGVILIALFAQTPELFVLALAVLVGGCTVVSCLVTNFRSYATALTAYTAAIIASDAINAPDQVFFIAMARTACILLGIACALVVTSIFAPHRSATVARTKLLTALKDAAERAVYSWKGTVEGRYKIGRKLILELIELDAVIEYAVAESATLRIQGNHARSLVAHIFSLISARRALDAHLVRCGWPRNNALEIFHEVIIDFLHEMPARLDRGEVDELITGLREVRDQLDLLRPEEETESSADLVSERFVVDRLDDLLTNLSRALEEWRDILQGRFTSEPRLTLNFHRDVRAAWINGLRSFVAVIITGAFWIGSAWVHGPGALVFVSVLLSIFASNPRPDKVGWAFFYASIPATVIGLLCKYLVISGGSGFEYLVVAMSFFLLPLGLFIAHPPTAVSGVAYSFVFLAVVAPTNPQVYDLSGSINSGLATIVGVLFGTLAYILIFPPDPAAARQYVTYRIRRGLEMISLLQPVPPTNSPWETRMYDRVMRLNDPSNPSGTPTDEWLDAGLGALNLGNELLRLRRRLANEAMPTEVREAASRVIGAYNRFLPEPQRALTVVKQEIARLSQLDPGRGGAERRIWARVLGNLEEMDVYLVEHPRLTKMEPAS
jgi:uncharacterized membrane protein YccC